MTSFRARLIGTWELVSFQAVNVADEADIIYPFQGDWHGLIMYTSDGYRSVQIQNQEVPRTGGGPVPGTVEDLAELARRTTNYTGPYHLKDNGPNDGKLYHENMISIPSIYNGITQTRLGHIFVKDGVQPRLEYLARCYRDLEKGKGQ